MAFKARILVVDDEPANRKLLAGLVAHEGYEALVASGGAEALEMLSSAPVDLVLLDLMMPEVGGMAVLAELQRRRWLPALPVVVVTALDDRKARLDALRGGAADFITKPIDRIEVACRIHALVELKQLRERSVASVEGKLVALVESASDAIVVADAEGRIRSWNQAAERMFGHHRAEALGKSLTLIVPEKYRRAHIEGMSRFKASAQHVLMGKTVELEGLRSDGTIFPLELSLSTWEGTSGREFGAIMRDITARREAKAALKKSEEQLRHAQKMEAIGQLAGGIAHDFNNILSVILSYSSFIQEALPEGDVIRDDILEVIEAGGRAVGLTQQLLAFARQQPTEKRAVDLNASLARLSKMLVRTLGEHIALKVTLLEPSAAVTIDPVQFDQIVLNLAVNARDAMLDGGQLHIALERAPAPSGEVEGQGWVRLRVADTGTGMDEPTQERVFEPFFTTTEIGKGTGLGLATCFGIITDAGGSIHIESALGLGTTFNVHLPICVGEVDPDVGASRALVLGGQGEVVLVAEDDKPLRKVTARVLEGAGYTVVEAADGDEAIELLDKLGSRLDILISDVVMPGRSGFDVVEHAQRAWPGIAVLLTSGVIDNRTRGGRAGDVPVLWKPVSPPDLVRAVARALEARSKGGALVTFEGGADAAAIAIEGNEAAQPAPEPPIEASRALRAHRGRPTRNAEALKILVEQAQAEARLELARVMRQLAHDLNTPIATLAMEVFSAQMMLDKLRPPAQADKPEEAARALSNLKDICANLEDVSSSLKEYMSVFSRLASDLPKPVNPTTSGRLP